jgi:hypothetical protein
MRVHPPLRKALSILVSLGVAAACDDYHAYTVHGLVTDADGGVLAGIPVLCGLRGKGVKGYQGGWRTVTSGGCAERGDAGCVAPRTNYTCVADAMNTNSNQPQVVAVDVNSPDAGPVDLRFGTDHLEVTVHDRGAADAPRSVLQSQ